MNTSNEKHATKAENLEFFRRKLPELLADPLMRYKFAVVYDREVKNAFDTFDAALRYAVANFQANEFVVQRVIDDREVISFIKAAC